MKKIFGRCRCAGQAILEYAVLLAIVAAAFATMTFYIKRAVQGKIYSMEGFVTARDNRSTSRSTSSGY